jgi:DivIVA domain-containing protein
MPVSAADVHNVAFHRPPVGKRGYDAAHVDAFLDEVERELVRLVEENNDLRAQVGHGRGTPATVAADSRLAAELDELKAQLDRLQRDKAAAERAARAVQAELEQMRARDARGVSNGGGQHALRVLTVAQRTAEDHVGDARREADKLLSDARTTAEDVSRTARATADALEREARQRYQEAMAGLDDKRTAAQTRIEELRELERGYRTRLTAYLEGLLRNLAGLGPETDGSRADSRPTGSPVATAAVTPAAAPGP